jgi:hypothetical protein
MERYSILNEATGLLERQLDLLAEVYESKKALLDAGSRYVCRCRSCRGQIARALLWLEGFESHLEAQPGTKAVARRTRLFPLVDRNAPAA